MNDSAGGAIFAHTRDAVFAQRLDVAGARPWGEAPVSICAATGLERAVHACSDGLGGAILAWEDSRNGNWDIYAQVVNHDGQVGAYWAPPVVPGGLQAVMNNSRSITVSWTPTDNIQEYRLYRGLSETQLSLVATVPSGTTQYVDEEGLAAGTLYYYKVQSANPRGESALSEAVSARTNQPPSGEVVTATGSIGANCTLSFNVTDPELSGALVVNAYHRRGGTTAFVRSSAALVAGTWLADVPGAQMTARGLQYYAMAYDGIDSTRIPATGYASVEIAISDPLAFRVVGSTDAAGYAMYGLPYVAADGRPAMVFDELGGYDATSWRYFTWNPTDGAYRENTSVQPGSGFWLISAKSADIAVTGTTTPLTGDFAITLQPGWNQIANPFSFEVPFSALERPAGTDAAIYRYNGSAEQQYDVLPLSSNPNLEPYRGYWLKHEGSPNAVLRVPPVSAGSTKAAVPPPWALGASEPGWSVQVGVTAGGRGDSGYRFGLREQASDARDACDLYAPPPAPGEYACLGFETAEGQRLWSDYRSVDAAGATWTLRLDATCADQPFEVRFTPERPLPAGWQLRAIDTGTLHEVDLLNEGRLAGRVVGSPFRRTWRLVAGPADYQGRARLDATEELTAGIVAFSFRPATPNPAPAGEGVTITLAAPRAIEGSLCVYDLRGRAVARLHEGAITAGLTSYHWDGRDDDGRRVAAGVYLVRMRAPGVALSSKTAIMR